MSTPGSWIICEKSGRWAAAVRVTLVRRKCSLPGSRIIETRSLVELDLVIQEHDAAFVLLEVRPESVADVLSFLTRSSGGPAPVVALLEFGAERIADFELVADALLEAGAIEVIDSSRQLGAVLEIAERQPQNEWSEHAGSIADRAWAALPWQDL
jgi:hypothetical protein